MKGLYSRLRNRLRRGEIGGAPDMDRITAELAELVQPAFPAPAASNALRERVAGICHAGVSSPRGLDLRLLPSRVRAWRKSARWAGAMTAAALAVALWLGGRPGGDVLAAVIHATEAARGWHLVATDHTGSVWERWFVIGVGSYEHRTNRTGRTEHIAVDDGNRRYLYKPDARRVEIWPSDLRDRAGTRRMQRQFSLSGIMKELQRQATSESIRIQDVVLNGRRLRRIGGAGSLPRLYVDPATDRVVRIEDTGRSGSFQRCEIDYPDPAQIDPARFRFTVPPGVTRVDRNYALQPLNSSEPGTVCAWRLLGLKQAFLGYLGDQQGEWPKALRPDLDSYVQDEGVFHCPADPGAQGKPTSYVYHRPAAPVDPDALEDRWRADNKSDPETSHRLGVLVECPVHNGKTLEKTALYRDGRVLIRPLRQESSTEK